jgi:hypothetical protein
LCSLTGTAPQVPSTSYEVPFGQSCFSRARPKRILEVLPLSLTFLPPANCSTCHEQIHKEWRESAHANSFRAPFYLKNAQLLIDQKGDLQNGPIRKSLIIKLVPKKGLEPPHPCEYMDLNHARLPIPPLRHENAPDQRQRLRREITYLFYGVWRMCQTGGEANENLPRMNADHADLVRR